MRAGKYFKDSVKEFQSNPTRALESCDCESYIMDAATGKPLQNAAVVNRVTKNCKRCEVSKVRFRNGE